jgi:hypothetical protein
LERDAILCLTDVAAMLSCSVEEATALLESWRVPALRLPSGSHRFMLGSVLDAVRSALTPYKGERAECPPHIEPGAIRRAWERWVLSRGHQVMSGLGEEWRSWVRMMVDEGMPPKDFFELAREERLEMIRRVNAGSGHLPFTENGDPLADPATPQCVSATTRVLGRHPTRKCFEKAG